MFTLLAIIVGSAGLSAVLILNNAAQAEYQSMGSNSLGLPNSISALISATNTNESPLSASDYSALRQKGFTNIVAFSQFITQLADGTPVTIVGADAPALALFADSKSDPLGLTESLLLSPSLYTLFKADALSAEAIESRLLQTKLPVFEAPTQPPNGEHLIVIDLYYFAAFVQGLSLEVNPVLPLEIAVIEGNKALEALLRQALPTHLQLKSLNQPIDPASITQSLHLNLLAMSIVMFAVCFFVVINALNLLLLGRAQLFKTLRQLGISRHSLVLAQIFELAIYAVFGACIGVFLGHYVAVMLAPTLALTLAGLFNVNLGFMQLDSTHLTVPMILLCFIAMLFAAILPYKRLNQTLSQKTFSAPLPSDKRGKVFWLFMAALLTTFVSGLWTPDVTSGIDAKTLLAHSLTATFVTIGCLISAGIVGLFFIYPIIIRSMTHIAERGNPLWHWSFSHSLIVADKTKLASAAFMIALVTHIGMNLMVDSFRESTSAWLEQRLTADYYAYADSTDISASKSLLENQGLRHYARNQIDSQATLIDNENARPQSVRIYSYPHDTEYQQALLVDTISPNAWQAFQDQNGIFINQQFAIRHSVQLNDSLQIDINGSNKTMTVKAIYMDYGNPYLQVLVAPEVFKPAANTRVLAIHLDGQLGYNKESLISLLPTTANLYSREELLSASMQAFDKTFLITDALNLVTLLVAVFSLTTSIILLEQKNRYVSALIRSFGVSKRRFTLALFSQYALLCLIAAFWAIPFGIAFAWLLVARLNVFAFQWQFPLSIAPLSILGTVCLSLVFVLALAAIPIVKRHKFSISEQLTCKE